MRVCISPPSLCFFQAADDVPIGCQIWWEAISTPPTYSSIPSPFPISTVMILAHRPMVLIFSILNSAQEQELPCYLLSWYSYFVSRYLFLCSHDASCVSPYLFLQYSGGVSRAILFCDCKHCQKNMTKKKNSMASNVFFISLREYDITQFFFASPWKTLFIRPLALGLTQ